MPAKRGLDWAGSSNDDIRGFPKEVRGQMAYAFFLAQEGKKHPDAKPLRGFGDTSVLEVVVDHDGDTFEAFTPPDFLAQYGCSIALKRSRKEACRHRRMTSI
jgi:phage-related protein